MRFRQLVSNGLRSRILSTVQAQPGVTVGQLANALAADQPRVSRAVQRLEAAGLLLVERGRASRCWPGELPPERLQWARGQARALHARGHSPAVIAEALHDRLPPGRRVAVLPATVAKWLAESAA